MRRVDKEKLKLFTKLGLIDSFNNLKQCNLKYILHEFDQCKKNTVLREWFGEGQNNHKNLLRHGIKAFLWQIAS